LSKEKVRKKKEPSASPSKKRGKKKGGECFPFLMRRGGREGPSLSQRSKFKVQEKEGTYQEILFVSERKGRDRFTWGKRKSQRQS